MGKEKATDGGGEGSDLLDAEDWICPGSSSIVVSFDNNVVVSSRQTLYGTLLETLAVPVDSFVL